MSLILILGPTASGKTSLSVEIAKEFNSEIVGADSVQIYKDLVIGSAAPSEEEKQGIPHHLTGVYPLNRKIDAGKYVSEALPIVEKILSKGKSCVITGGTNFYVEAFLNGLSPVPKIEDPVRKQIEDELEKHETEVLYERLLQTDQEWAGQISSPNDRQRIKRGLEVYMATGKKLSQWNKNKKEKKYSGKFIALSIDKDREELYSDINRRSLLMVQNGLIEEVKEINRKGFGSHNCKAMNSIGYKETEMYLKGEIKSISELTELIAANTRHLAKRQLTWLRNRHYVKWAEKKNIPRIVNKYFGELNNSSF